MVITIDIGNTDIVSILFDQEGNKIRHQRVSLERSRLKENTDFFVIELIRTWQVEDADYIVSCVVPALIADLKVSLNKYFKHEGFFIDYTSYESLVEGLEYPAQIGADLLAASAGVLHYHEPTLIVDMGSATKYILVKDQKLHSVAILLGVKNNMLALSNSIEHLPHVELQFSNDLLGKDTIEAIQAGLMYSTLFAIRGHSQALEETYNIKLKKILTGGISNLFKEQLADYEFHPDLVNEGLFEIYRKNRDTK